MMSLDQTLVGKSLTNGLELGSYNASCVLLCIFVAVGGSKMVEPPTADQLLILQEKDKNFGSLLFLHFHCSV